MEKNTYYLTDEEIAVLKEEIAKLNPGELKTERVLRNVKENKGKYLINAHLMEEGKLPTLKDLAFLSQVKFSLVKDFVAKVYDLVKEEHKRLIAPEENLEYYTDQDGYIYTKGPGDIKLYKYRGYDCFVGYNNAGEEILFIKLGDGKIGQIIDDGLIYLDGKSYVMEDDGNIVEAPNITYFSPKKR